MLGAQCSCFCDQCNCTSEGTAPAVASDADKGLVWLEFSACIGTGAAGTVDAPTAATPCDYEGMAGPITGVTLTSGGSGYARLGRVSPTITASVSGGSSATLSVTLSEESENLGKDCMAVPYWSVASVSVTSGGSGYTDDTAVTFSAAGGDTTVNAAAGRAYVEIDEPMNANFDIDSNGVDAVLTAVWSELDEDEWADVRTPNPCAAPKKRTYALASVSVTNGGSGYAQFDRIYISFPTAADGGVDDQAYIDVESVDGNGAITSVFVSPDDGLFVEGPGGVYIGSLTDELAHVVVNSCVSNGAGHYYREDASEPPYVAAVTVTVNQEAPSTGNGAAVTATVEDDTASADFGKVISLSLDNGGTGYLQPSPACPLPDTMYVTVGSKTVAVPVRIAGLDGYPVFDELQAETNCGAYEECEAVGQTFSIALAYVDPSGLECKCNGRLHVSVSVTFACLECLTDNRIDAAVSNYFRFRTACMRFDNDESGCPTGDAVLVGWTTGELQPGHCGISDDCDCDSECDIELLPTISFLP